MAIGAVFSGKEPVDPTEIPVLARALVRVEDELTRKTTVVLRRDLSALVRRYKEDQTIPHAPDGEGISVPQIEVDIAVHIQGDQIILRPASRRDGTVLPSSCVVVAGLATEMARHAPLTDLVTELGQLPEEGQLDHAKRRLMREKGRYTAKDLRPVVNALTNPYDRDILLRFVQQYDLLAPDGS